MSAAIGLAIAGLIFWAIKLDNQFEQKMKTEYANCLKAKETEYSCKTYIANLRTQRSAEIAATNSGLAVGFTAASASQR